MECALTEDKVGPDRATALAWLRMALADELDGVMKSSGFKRSARSVSYLRPWGDGRQKIEFELIVRPRYAPHAIQVSLSAFFISAEIAAIARMMLPGDDAEIVRKDVVQRSVLDQIMRNPPVLEFADEPELRESVAQLKSWVASSVVPYLDARSSVEDLVRLDLRSLMDQSKPGDLMGPSPCRARGNAEICR